MQFFFLFILFTEKQILPNETDICLIQFGPMSSAAGAAEAAAFVWETNLSHRTTQASWNESQAAKGAAGAVWFHNAELRSDHTP